MVGSIYPPTKPQVHPDTPRYVAHLGVTFAAAFISVPTGLALASLLGNLSINLIATGITYFLVVGLVAPTLTTLAAYLFGNMNFFGRDDKPFAFLVPWLGAIGVNALAVVIAGFAGVSLGVPASLFIFAAIDGALLAGSTVGLMHLLKRQPMQVTTLASPISGVSPTTLVPLAQTTF